MIRILDQFDVLQAGLPDNHGKMIGHRLARQGLKLLKHVHNRQRSGVRGANEAPGSLLLVLAGQAEAEGRQALVPKGHMGGPGQMVRFLCVGQVKPGRKEDPALRFRAVLHAQGRRRGVEQQIHFQGGIPLAAAGAGLDALKNGFQIL